MLGLMKYVWYKIGSVFLCIMTLGIIAMIVVTAFDFSNVISIVVMLFIAVTPMSLMSNDKKESVVPTMQYKNTLPLKKSLILGSEYLVYLCVVAIFALLCMVITAIIRSSMFSEVFFLSAFAIFVALAIASCYFPVLYIVKDANPEILSPFCMMAGVALLIGVVELWLFFFKDSLWGSNVFAGFVVVLGAVLYFLSYLFLLVVYKKKEF